MVEIPNWRTSSYTGTETCVEVADNDPDRVLVRDAKRRDRAIVGVNPAAWVEFVNFARQPG
ncbi:DUF397 domain-containing protein [Streptomyces katrae]|uniref:DUF397 domain-containing protein n=1 Tax=Streptomyces katrae TaxID=68223 RepID=UPI0004C0A272|nr:DUF397 domain-containing protein [Streptomyces katrae]